METMVLILLSACTILLGILAYETVRFAARVRIVSETLDVMNGNRMVLTDSLHEAILNA